MNNKYKYLSKNVLLFGISNFFPKLIALVVIPIYTSVLSTEEVGIAENIDATLSLLIPILTLCIRDAVLRYMLDSKENKINIMSNALIVQLISTIFVILSSVIFQIFNNGVIDYIYFVFLCVMFFIGSIAEICTYCCRGTDKVSAISIGAVIAAIVLLISNIIFLLVIKIGLYGYLLANILGSFSYVIFLIAKGKIYLYINIKLDYTLLKKMLAYSIPLILSAILWWCYNASNRYILTIVLGVSASGMFAVASKLPNMIQLIETIINSAWQISAIKEFDKNDKDGFINNTFWILLTSVILASSLLLCFNIPLAKILFSNDFYYAYQYTPPLYISMVLLLCSNFIDGIFLSLKKTRIIAFSSLISGLSTIICTVFFVNFVNIHGASFGTLIGTIVLVSIKLLLVRKYFKLKINKLKLLISIITLIIQAGLCYFDVNSFWLQVILFLIIFLTNLNLLKTIFAKIRNLI